MSSINNVNQHVVASLFAQSGQAPTASASSNGQGSFSDILSEVTNGKKGHQAADPISSMLGQFNQPSGNSKSGGSSSLLG